MGGGAHLPLLGEFEDSMKEHPQYDYNVFVTGFGPFPNGKGGTYENASHLLTRLLPTSLQVDVGSDRIASASKVDVRILNPTAGEGKYLPTEYARIRSYLADVYASYASPLPNQNETSRSGNVNLGEASSTKRKIDLFLHVGMADGWDFVSIERRAYKQGMSSTWDSPGEIKEYYTNPDNTGKTILDAGPSPWSSLPMGLDTAFNVDRLVEAANETLQELWGTNPEYLLPVKPHDDPGSYCCGFTFYESLAQCFIRSMTRNVIFCHIPGETDRPTIERGRDAVVAVIEAAIRQLIRKNKST